jgi:hypothetical protein
MKLIRFLIHGSRADAPPSSLQELMRSIPTAPIVKGGEVVPDMPEKPKAEMPSFRYLLESAPMVELSNVEMPSIKSLMESASETPNSEVPKRGSKAFDVKLALALKFKYE